MTALLDVEAGIFRRLVQDPEIGGLVADHVFPGMAPQHASLPYIVIADRVSTIRRWDMRGTSGLATARVQVDVYAASRSEAKALAFHVRESLDGFAGSLGDGLVQMVQAIDQAETVEPPGDASERPTFRVRFDFLVHSNETRPNR